MSVLPPVPLDTKIDETNPQAHVMQLYPDLFDGVRTIKNAVVHLDLKPDAVPIVWSPRRVADTHRDSLKVELDRMEFVIPPYIATTIKPQLYPTPSLSTEHAH